MKDADIHETLSSTSRLMYASSGVDEQCGPVDTRDRVEQLLLTAAGEHDRRTLAQEPPGRSRPDTRSRPGDDDDLVFKTLHHSLYVLLGIAVGGE